MLFVVSTKQDGTKTYFPCMALVAKEYGCSITKMNYVIEKKEPYNKTSGYDTFEVYTAEEAFELLNKREIVEAQAKPQSPEYMMPKITQKYGDAGWDQYRFQKLKNIHGFLLDEYEESMFQDGTIPTTYCDSISDCLSSIHRERIRLKNKNSVTDEHRHASP